MATKRVKKRAPTEEAVAPERRALHYKVVELSSVDEHTLERTLNEWVPMGWKFDGLQFAMRESSKRPSMAFVFFTREGPAVTDSTDDEITVPGGGRALDVAEQRLRHLADDGAKSAPAVSAWERLAQLAGDDDA